MIPEESKSFCKDIPPMTLTVAKILAAIELTGRVSVPVVTTADHQWALEHDDELFAAGLSHCYQFGSGIQIWIVFFKKPAP